MGGRGGAVGPRKLSPENSRLAGGDGVPAPVLP